MRKINKPFYPPTITSSLMPFIEPFLEPLIICSNLVLATWIIESNWWEKMNILTCKRNDRIMMTRVKGHADFCANISKNSPEVALRAYTSCTTSLGTLNTIIGCWNTIDQNIMVAIVGVIAGNNVCESKLWRWFWLIPRSNYFIKRHYLTWVDESIKKVKEEMNGLRTQSGV